jgi:hypothetical protein
LRQRMLLLGEDFTTWVLWQQYEIIKKPINY